MTEQQQRWSLCFVIFLISLLQLKAVYAVEFNGTKVQSDSTDNSDYASRQRVQTVLSIPRMVASEKLNKFGIIDPHWDRAQCGICHNGIPTKNNLKLHIRDINKLCESCHQFVPLNLLNHPVNLKPKRKMLKRMPIEYKKTLNSKLAKKGTMSCLTCHDVVMQCTPSKFVHQGRNREFFRLGPFRSRTDMCFKCHNKNNFKRFNPHQQISKSGKIKKSTCYVCHKEVDKLSKIKSAKELKFNVSDYSKMCTGCHVWKPHPGGELAFGFRKKKPNHLVKASDMVLLQMKFMLPKEKMYVPLEPGTGRVHCATCHNVHQKGVLKNKVKSMGADSEHKVRRKDMCKICHPI
jgi:predicted CXXCH cytochrome family protein